MFSYLNSVMFLQSDIPMKQRTILVLGPGLPLTGGITTVIHDQFYSSLAQSNRLVLFDTRKRTRLRRTLLEGVVAQLILLTAFLVKLLTLRPDLVHIHVGGDTDIFRKGWDVLLARICRRRVLLHIHGGDFDRFFTPDNQRSLKRIQRIFRQCNGVIALSDFWRSLYVRIVDSENIHVVNNCVDLELYRSLDRRAARRALNLPPNAPVVLHLGSQGKRKGTFDLLRAIPQVLDAAQETVVILVGPDEDVHPGAIFEGQSLADELGISHAVRFLGTRTGQQKLDCLGAADLFVLPSYNENFPISILEAMASGLPVISTNVGGIPEILSDAFPEDLIEAGDSVALSERIKEYVSKPKLIQESGRRNQAAAEQRFSMDVFAQCLGDAYDAAWNK
jgi:glycosyltransferase involved in cell wall biosynthesis